MSVWDSIDRSRFEHNLAVLCKKDKYQDMQQYPAILASSRCEPENAEPAMSTSAVCQLADDCAFLASWTTLPPHVAASTVQLKSSPDRVCISIAANQGIATCVKAAFEAMVTVLEKRASHGERS